jgi:hypothetical protein
MQVGILLIATLATCFLAASRSNSAIRIPSRNRSTWEGIHVSAAQTFHRQNEKREKGYDILDNAFVRNGVGGLDRVMDSRHSRQNDGQAPPREGKAGS